MANGFLRPAICAAELLALGVLSHGIWKETAPEFPTSVITADKVKSLVGIDDTAHQKCEQGGQKGLDAIEAWLPERGTAIAELGLRDESRHWCVRNDWSQNHLRGYVGVSEPGVFSPTWRITGHAAGTATFESNAFLRPSVRHQVVYDPTQAAVVQSDLLSTTQR